MQIEVTYNQAPLTVNFPDELFETLQIVSNAKGGQFAFIEKHVSGLNDKKCIKPHVSDILFHIKPNYGKFLKIRQEAISGLELEDIELTTEIINRSKDIQADFETAKSQILDSIKKSLEKDVESNGFRIGSNLCYAHYNGVRLHLETKTVKEDNKPVKRPFEAENGLFTVSSILLPFYTVNRKTVEAGEWKPTKSEVVTLIKKQIENKCKVYDWKAFSLGKGNFKEIHMDSKKIFGKVKDWTDTEKDENTAIICGTSMLPKQELEKDAEQAEQAEQF